VKAVLPLLRRLYKWEYIWLCLIVLATLLLHFVIVASPAELVLDEQYYIKEARSISENQTILFQEHPPLGKLLIVAGIKIFGDNTLGWRFFSIILGTGCIVLFYFICRRLNMSSRTASIATSLLALENMTFVVPPTSPGGPPQAQIVALSSGLVPRLLVGGATTTGGQPTGLSGLVITAGRNENVWRDEEGPGQGEERR
jgi:4-amino-4-deoxy-L-arabinose transferase-like glycosyltransferase